MTICLCMYDGSCIQLNAMFDEPMEEDCSKYCDTPACQFAHTSVIGFIELYIPTSYTENHYRKSLSKLVNGKSPECHQASTLIVHFPSQIICRYDKIYVLKKVKRLSEGVSRKLNLKNTYRDTSFIQHIV